MSPDWRTKRAIGKWLLEQKKKLPHGSMTKAYEEIGLNPRSGRKYKREVEQLEAYDNGKDNVALTPSGNHIVGQDELGNTVLIPMGEN